jgi:Zn-dependent M28 family amino/carboxypeptidase
MYLLNNMQSFELNAKLEFRGKYKTRDFKGRNVVGIIEGNDINLKNEHLILSAHYDHLGIGPAINGDSIYNGFMDNAIGCAALLEIARIYKEENILPSRSIIFLFVTGEEKGLLGSTYYTDFPIKPISNTIANINIDGVAVIDEFQSIISIGGKFSTLDRIIRETALEFELVLEEFSEAITETESFNKSDQVAFANAGVPACMILDGTYYKNFSENEGIDILYDYFVNRYHKPIDDKSQHINYNAVKQHIAFLTKFSLNVANSYTSPQWNEDSIFGQR